MKNKGFRIPHWIFILFFFAFRETKALAQNNRVVDSLRNVLKAEPEDTGKVNTLNILCQKLWRKGNFDTAMIQANASQLLAERLKFKRGFASALVNVGIIYTYQGNFKKALDYLFRALGIYKELDNKYFIAHTMISIGIAYKNQGDYSNALEYYIKALPIEEELKDKSAMASAQGNIALVYQEQGNYPKALEYNFKALTIFEETGDKNYCAGILGNIAIIYQAQADYSKALEYSNKALVLQEKIGNKNIIANNLTNMAIVYLNLKDFDKALEYTSKALALYKETGDKNGISSGFCNMGLIYFEAGNYDKALEYDLKGLDIERETGNKPQIANNMCNIGNAYIKLKKLNLAKSLYDSALILSKAMHETSVEKNTYAGLAGYDSAMGDFKQALVDYKMYITYRDSLTNESNTKKTVQAEMNFEFEQKQAVEKAEQDKKDALADQERNKQKVIRNSFIAGFALTLTLAFFIFRGYREKQKANLVISSQKAEVEEKQKEILDSIHYAQRIQKALLASDALLSKNLPGYFVLYKPKDIVSGDFYWATTKDNSFYLAVCDSTGHGVPGAFMSLLNISFLNEAITEKSITRPNEVFNHVRKRLIENVSQDGGQDGMDGVLAFLNLSEGGTLLSYAAAYNAPVVIRNKEIIELPADKMPVGSSPKNDVPFTCQSFELQKGDTIYLFSDGFADQFGGPKAKKYMHKKFLEKLLAISHQPLAEQKDILNTEFEKWKSNLEQVDDVLVIGIRI